MLFVREVFCIKKLRHVTHVNYIINTHPSMMHIFSHRHWLYLNGTKCFTTNSSASKKVYNTKAIGFLAIDKGINAGNCCHEYFLVCHLRRVYWIPEHILWWIRAHVRNPITHKSCFDVTTSTTATISHIKPYQKT